MLTDLAKELHKLSDDEIEQFELALRKEKASRKINEILEAAKEARKEHNEEKRTLHQHRKKSFSGLKM